MNISDAAGPEELYLPSDLRAPDKLSASAPGYCHACGTWDLHMRKCPCCGFDFDAQTPIDDY